MKKLSFIIASLSTSFVLCTLPAYGADIGLGASVRADDASIYFPLQFGENFRLEAELRSFQGEANAAISNSAASPSGSSSDSKLFGVGVFYTKSISENARLLAGLRASYLQSEYKSGSAVSSFGSSSFYETELDGYEVAPTIGLEYSFTENILVAVEAYWFDRSLDGESTSVVTSGGVIPITNITANDIDRDENGTDARVVLRFFF